ncbi:MAG: hypothetical protein S4CHLAM6_10230 [Chlamydiae bacterium]|nr:hypothetical protein [Chlamydiota bacterium]
MTEYLNYIVLFVLCLWIILTILLHTKWESFKTFLANYDLVALIPSWNFFAPNPPPGDYCIMYRFKTEKSFQKQSQWESIPMPKRKSYNFFWNPYRRDRKTIYDICSSLTDEWRDIQKLGYKHQFIQTSLPFLIIANFLPKIVRKKSSQASLYQFSILLINNSLKRNEPIFMSKWLNI